jgi:hypothetical protein
MAEINIIEDGEYYFNPKLGFNVSRTDSTTVLVLENSASATLEFGCEDSAGSFVGYPNGTFSDGRVINHGRGAKPMVKATGISTGSVTLGIYPK